MSLYEIIKADGTKEKVEADIALHDRGILRLRDEGFRLIESYAPGTWLEVWRREGVGE
jgi:hypothetical protein